MNFLILLAAGVSLGIAHHCLYYGLRTRMNTGAALIWSTVVLSIVAVGIVLTGVLYG